MVGRGLSRFVGRDKEMRSLAEALDRVRKGHGQVIAIVGEPGVGKSRLFWEFTRSSAMTGCLLLECGVIPHAQPTTLLPVIEILRAYFALEDRDDPEVVRRKVSERVDRFGSALASQIDVFLSLLKGERMVLDARTLAALGPNRGSSLRSARCWCWRAPCSLWSWCSRI